MPELGSLGSVRGALSNGRPYRERWIQRYVPEFEKRWNRFASRQAVHDASMKLT